MAQRNGRCSTRDVHSFAMVTNPISDRSSINWPTQTLNGADTDDQLMGVDDPGKFKALPLHPVPFAQ